MDGLLTNIMNKWKDSSVYGDYSCKFVIMYTSTAVEFMKLLETWRVPYRVDYDKFRAEISTLNYWYVMQHKAYYWNNRVTAEIESKYYSNNMVTAEIEDAYYD